MSHPALSVKEISKRFGAHQALNNVSLDIPKGSIYGLLGPNGAGKTTLFSIIAGFVHADTGTVQVLGHPHRDPQVLRGMLGVLPQDAAFQSDISILDQLVYFLRLSGRSVPKARREVAEALDKVGLSDWLGRRSNELSHGMYKRLCLAQAFLGDPQVVLLDEPTAGLDPANAENIRALIRDQAIRRAAVVVSSHDMSEMQGLCSHVAILKKGQLVSQGLLTTVTAAVGRVRMRLYNLDKNLLTALAAQTYVNDIKNSTPNSIELTLTDTAIHYRQQLQRLCLDHNATIQTWEEGNTLAEHFASVTTATVTPATITPTTST